MDYRGFIPTCLEFMVRFQARSAMYGGLVGMRALSDPGPGTMEDKLNRAMEALFNGELDTTALGSSPQPRVIEAAPSEPERRKPGRPPKDRSQQNGQPGTNGAVRHD